MGNDNPIYVKLTISDLTDAHVDEICAHTINGGSVLDLCEKWGLEWDKVWLWLMASKDRQGKYERACHAQGEWAIARILKEIRLLAFTDHRDLYNAEKRMKHPTEWSKELGAVVEGYEVVEYFEGAGRNKEQVGWLKKVKLYDKQKALELYGKYLKMFGDRQVDVNVSLEDLVDASMDMRSVERIPGLGVN